MEEKNSLIETILYYGAIAGVIVLTVLLVLWTLHMGVEKVDTYFNPKQESVDERFTAEYSGILNVYHDNELNVTCYSIGVGLSCIPDAEIGRR